MLLLWLQSPWLALEDNFLKIIQRSLFHFVRAIENNVCCSGACRAPGSSPPPTRFSQYFTGAVPRLSDRTQRKNAESKHLYYTLGWKFKFNTRRLFVKASLAAPHPARAAAGAEAGAGATTGSYYSARFTLQIRYRRNPFSARRCHKRNISYDETLLGFFGILRCLCEYSVGILWTKIQ